MKRNKSNSSSSVSSVFIKGYLPVRLRLPPVISKQSSDRNEDHSRSQLNETIFYVKEHYVSGTSQSTNTLFIANAPVVPYVKTQLVLKSIFGRYGEITRVTVLPNPRRQSNKDTTDDSIMASATSLCFICNSLSISANTSKEAVAVSPISETLLIVSLSNCLFLSSNVESFTALNNCAFLPNIK